MMHQSTCECESATCPTDSGYFYASIRNDSGEHRLLLGPFPTHAAALASVRLAEQMAERYDPRAHWYSYGTARTETAMRSMFSACPHCGEIGYLSRVTCPCIPKCPECGSTEGQYVPPGSGDAACLHCGADWPVTEEPTVKRRVR